MAINFTAPVYTFYMEQANQKVLYVIDGYNLIFRMFYAVPEFRTREGKVVNATFGVAKALLQILREDQPSHIFVAFDVGSDTFRKQMYEDYKSNRDRMPDSLSDQIEDIMQVFTLLDIPQIWVPGYEADDIIGSITNHSEIEHFDRVLICSSDKDLFQFIDENRIRVYDMMKKRIFSRKEAVEKFWVQPEFVVDYLAIVGDTSDMIPGVAGIGPKWASKLINEYGSLESIYDHIDDISGAIHTKLVASKDLAFLSKKLATIDTSLDLSSLTLDGMKTQHSYDDVFTDDFIEFLSQREFNSLIPEDKITIQRTEFWFQDVHLTEKKQIEAFCEDVSKHNKIILKTRGGRTTLESITCTISGDPVYTMNASDMELMRHFLDLFFGLSEDVEIIWYDLKMDIRRMRFFLDKTQWVSDVMSLF